MNYTAPYVMLLMRAASITWASGKGLGPGNREFFWVLWKGIEPIGEGHLGPNPFPLVEVMDASRIKSITHGAV